MKHGDESGKSWGRSQGWVNRSNYSVHMFEILRKPIKQNKKTSTNQPNASITLAEEGGIKKVFVGYGWLPKV